MTDAARQRLFAYEHAFDHPVTLTAVVLIAVLLVATPVVVWLLRKSAAIDTETYSEIMLRCRSWRWLSALMLIPVLAGAAWVMAGVLVLSLFCYSEFARATGVFREKLLSLVVALGTMTLAFAAVDNYVRLFFAVAPLTVGMLAIVTIPQDRPKGYIRRVGLGVLGFLLFCYCLGYLALFTNDPSYRPILILLILGVELNDVFAYCAGRIIGGPILLPETSPKKTIAGAVGALLLTTAFVGGLGHFVFRGTAMDRLDLLLILGAGLSILGQLGDLLMSSIKRDIGIKDIGQTIPGHGGLLDRFDSLVLVPPAAYHFLSLHLGPIGAGYAERIFTAR